jgi:hypothetical protein
MPALGVPSINLITALRERRAEVDLVLPEKVHDFCATSRIGWTDSMGLPISSTAA